MRNKVLPYDPTLKEFARKLRKESTLSEVLLWKRIKGKTLGCEFHRQVPIARFIVDFYCHEIMLAIEIDGCSHVDLKKDDERQAYLEKMGVRFIRFSDRMVKTDIENVMYALGTLVEKLQSE
jgi:very-short-patch-repair endonuclease